MQENRNSSFCGSCANNVQSNCEKTVCIDTKRVLDSCRDKDCYEDVRVYLTEAGEQLLASSTNARTRSARLLWAYVGVDEVPFNNGFYHVTVRYYVEVEFEVCIGVGRSQTLKGIATLEKDVILYGGEGRAISFSSSTENTYCNVCDFNNSLTNDPVAIVETVEPVVLGTKINDCNCGCTCTEFAEIPECVRRALGGEIVINTNGPKIYVSFGVFSVIRIVRPAQLLVKATDYTVPDKECTAATNNDSPCALFRTMPFPTSQFRGTDAIADVGGASGGGCGCGKNK